FGLVDMRLQCKPGKATLRLNNKFTENPDELVLHLPWFMDVHSLTADGKTITPKQSATSIPIGTNTVEINWTRKQGVQPLSYEKAVIDYKKEYRRRYEEFLSKGK
ncbi:MAG: hypothetical protein AABZ61_09600, partial [Bacteroidota bacterium]